MKRNLDGLYVCNDIQYTEVGHIGGSELVLERLERTGQETNPRKEDQKLTKNRA